MSNPDSATQDKTPAFRYVGKLAQQIEAKWQDRWDENQTFHVPNPGDANFDASKPKQFIMDMFPYPSGVGLHVGHPLGYIATDLYARYLRMKGFNVLHPMGYDAFGLPAEQYAIQTGQHPRITTEKNIANMQSQMRRLGLGHDPQRGLATIDVEFYKWTQWIFLEIYNSWYDDEADRARPIATLIEKLESGAIPAGDGETNPEGKTWTQLSQNEQAAIIDSHRLAYLAEIPVNWCPALGTVLANEEVNAEGRSERGDHPVFRRPLKQWMMRITEYCDRLLDDLEPLDWPEPIKKMQRDWIGKSKGAEVDFLAVEPGGDSSGTSFFESRKKLGWAEGSPIEELAIRVFTTRPDTLYGATYMVLAPEHPLVDQLTQDEWPETTVEAWKGQFPGSPEGASPKEMVQSYRAYAESKSDVDRQKDEKVKTGVFTGSFAINPVNGHLVPIFIADYVLMGYGTGAIMAVPAHDERDFEFARQFELPTPIVVEPPKKWKKKNIKDGELVSAFSGEGKAVNSEVIDGLETQEAKAKIIGFLEEQGLGKGAINYRLRDWLFSRQRYWGEPFPIIFDEDGQTIALTIDDLPVELPEVDNYAPETNDDPDSKPQPPLGRAKEWAKVTIDGKEYARELNTMPNWAGSCWYYLRYLQPQNNNALVDKEVESYWMHSAKKGKEKGDTYDPQTSHIGGVDLYVGGAEHAVLHLLYSRFWHKLLFDLGHVSTPEPFGRLFNQGYVQAASYKNSRNFYVEASEVEEKDGQFFFEDEEVKREFGKMGKSLKNAVSPDEMCETYGADTLRLYEMYMGPLEASKPWNTRDIVGVYRFLQRLWRNLVDEDSGELLVTDNAPDEETERLLHKTIAGATKDMESLGFNTAIAKLIEFNNHLTSQEKISRSVAEPLVQMLSPLAPHIAEELWEKLGHTDGITYTDYPVANPDLLVEDSIELPVMINGKVRGKINVSPEANPKELEEAALANERVAESLEGLSIKKVIAIPGKMINLVAK